jgi:hypothetical protein
VTSADGLRHLTNPDGAWSGEVVSADALGRSAIALDGADRPHLVFLDQDGEVRHASVAAGAWSLESVDSAAGDESCGAPQMAIDEADAVHVTFSAGLGPCELRYATNGSGRWVVEVLSSGGRIESRVPIAVSAGAVHVAYVDDGLRYATRRLPDHVDGDCDGSVW